MEIESQKTTTNMEDSQLKAESTKNYYKSNAEDYIRKFRCEMCRSRFSSQENLESHKISHQSDGVLKCATCEKQFDTVQGLFITFFLS